MSKLKSVSKILTRSRLLAVVLASASWVGVVAVPAHFPPTPEAVGVTGELFFLAITFTSVFFEDLLLSEKWYVLLRRSVWVAMAFSVAFAGLVSRSIPWKLLGVWGVAVILFEAVLSIEL